MPLFSFLCTHCHAESEILVRQGEQPRCLACGGTELEQLLAHFAPMQGGSTVAEPAGCGAAQCCQALGRGCMN